MKNSTYWLFSFIRNSIFRLLLITALTSSCTKTFYPEAPQPQNDQEFKIDFELLDDIRSDPKYKEVLEVSSESYKKRYVDSLLASSIINDSTYMYAHNDYILHKYIIIDRYIKSYSEFNYEIVGRHVRYDLMEKKKEGIKKTRQEPLHVDDIYIRGYPDAVLKRIRELITMVRAMVKITMCPSGCSNGVRETMIQAYAERLESFRFPYGQVVLNINCITSNMINDMYGDPMQVFSNTQPSNFCWDELMRQYTLGSSADKIFLTSLHNRICRKPASSGGGGGGGIPGENPAINRSPKELCDPEKFVDFAVYEDCYKGCEKILKNYGLTNFGSPTAVFQLLDENSNKSESNVYLYAIDCIDKHLNSNRPIIVGITYGGESANHDGITDHFVVITGRGYNTTSKLYYYTYMETGTGGPAGYNTNTNRLYYNSSTKDFYDSQTALSRSYDVTHVRPNNGNTIGTTSQIK